MLTALLEPGAALV